MKELVVITSSCFSMNSTNRALRRTMSLAIALFKFDLRKILSPISPSILHLWPCKSVFASPPQTKGPQPQVFSVATTLSVSEYRFEPPSEFPLTSPFPGIVHHHLSRPNKCVHIQSLRIGRRQRAPDSSYRSPYLIKLLNSSNLEVFF